MEVIVGPESPQPRVARAQAPLTRQYPLLGIASVRGDPAFGRQYPGAADDGLVWLTALLSARLGPERVAAWRRRDLAASRAEAPKDLRHIPWLGHATVSRRADPHPHGPGAVPRQNAKARTHDPDGKLATR